MMKKIENKIATIFVIGLVLIVLSGIVSAGTYTSFSSGPTYQPSFNTFYGGTTGGINGGTMQTLWPQLGDQTCENRQDIILQVPPAGCQPTVVRSDLLADQNVAVFCQVNALKMNPLLDIREISSIGFEGNYPKEVIGTGFHPARAALRTYDQLLGSPISNNIGYAVIVLRQTKNESSLPDKVAVNLTAQMRYDAANVLGTGKSEFILQPMSDDKWAQSKYKQSFWDGQYSVRLDSADDNSAQVSIYKGDNRISTNTVAKGETSQPVYFPGTYCSAGLNIVYDGLTAYPPTARIEVTSSSGTDSYDVYEGSRFMNNKCSVEKLRINDYDETGYLKVNCPGNSFTIALEPKLLSASQLIPASADTTIKDKFDYFGGKSGSGLLNGLIYGTKEICEVGLTAGRYIPGDTGYYSIQRTYKVDSMAKSKPVVLAGSRGDWELFYRKDKTSSSGEVSMESKMSDTSGQWLKNLKNELMLKCHLPNIASDTVMAKDYLNETIYDDTTEKYFNDAIAEYEKIADEYSAEKITDLKIDGINSYGVKALLAAIDLAEMADKQQTKGRLIDKLLDKYPDAKGYDIRTLSAQRDALFNVDSSKATKVTYIDKQPYMIKLVSLSEPPDSDNEKAGATFKYKNKEIKVGLKGDYKFTTTQGEQSFRLSFLYDANTAWVFPTCTKSSGVLDVRSVTFIDQQKEAMRNFGSLLYDNSMLGTRISVGQTTSICGEEFTLEDVNIAKAGKIRLIPKADYVSGKTNLTVTIGIEKRAIQLNPDETEDKIATLNKTIKQWEDLSKKLETVVSTMKAACLATSAVLTIKNFVTGLTGESLARQQVMRGEGGWTERCQNETSQWGSLSKCYSHYAPDIEKDVKAYQARDKKVNEFMTSIESQCKVENKNTPAFLSIIEGGDTINRDQCAGLLAKQIQTDCGSVNVKLKPGDTTDPGVAVKGLLDPTEGKKDSEGWRKVGYTELRDMYANCLVASGKVGASSMLQSKSLTDLTKTSTIIADGKRYDQESADFAQTIKQNKAFENVPTYADMISTNRRAITGNYYGGTVPASELADYATKHGDTLKKDPNAGVPIAYAVVDGQTYVMALQKMTGDQLKVVDAYKLEGGKVVPLKDTGAVDSISERNNVMSSFNGYKEISKGSWYNPYENPEVKFYETDPYKGLPAIVPFDIDQGWYVATKQNLGGLNGIKAFDSSGRATSFWVCNVGSNKRNEFFATGYGDDHCTQFNVDTGQSMSTMFGLSETEAKRRVQQAIQALNSAAEQYKQGKKEISIPGVSQRIKVGSPATSVPGQECQDYMSPADCKTLFNVCDPVICPASRCNFGGKYQVPDVIQSGIVGSAVLCLPNFPEVYVPVCLSGIQAGVDAFTSIIKSYRDCLQRNLNTGEMTGFCDEIYSIYMCDFFWRQVVPVANQLLPKLIETATGQGNNVRGGGEYKFVATAWQNAQDSISYFTNTYAINSMTAFQNRNVEEVGSDVCKGFISAKVPTDFASWIKPDSPTQFYAYFSSDVENTATVPATAHYKVYYHIYGGKDTGVYFSVYLKDPPASSYYSMSPQILVNQSYIAKGDYADASIDFTAPEGYKQLCVNINGVDKCGFKQVSTDASINYIKDSYVQSQILEKDVKTEGDCVSGTVGTGIGGLVSLNVQSGVQEAINPEIYNRGITRVCATDNPGGKYSTRYVDVGYCGDQKVRCWLDQDSVNKSIGAENLGMLNATFNQLKETLMDNLKNEGVYTTAQAAAAVIRALQEKANVLIKLWQVKDVLFASDTNLNNLKSDTSRFFDNVSLEFEKMLMGNNKAQTLFISAEVRDAMARPYISYAKTQIAGQQTAGTGGTGGGTTKWSAGNYDSWVYKFCFTTTPESVSGPIIATAALETGLSTEAITVGKTAANMIASAPIGSTLNFVDAAGTTKVLTKGVIRDSSGKILLSFLSDGSDAVAAIGTGGYLRAFSSKEAGLLSGLGKSVNPSLVKGFITRYIPDFAKTATVSGSESLSKVALKMGAKGLGRVLMVYGAFCDGVQILTALEQGVKLVGDIAAEQESASKAEAMIVKAKTALDTNVDVFFSSPDQSTPLDDLFTAYFDEGSGLVGISSTLDDAMKVVRDDHVALLNSKKELDAFYESKINPETRSKTSSGKPLAPGSSSEDIENFGVISSSDYAKYKLLYKKVFDNYSKLKRDLDFAMIALKAFSATIDKG